MSAQSISLLAHQASLNELVRLLVFKNVLTGDEGHQILTVTPLVPAAPSTAGDSTATTLPS